MLLSELKLNPDNPRTIKQDKLEKLAQSIKDFPKMMVKRPIVYDENKVIIGGNMRYRAIQSLGMTEIPDEWTSDASDFTEEERHRFIMQDNAEMGETDYDMVANQYELEDLDAWGIDVPLVEDEIKIEEDEAPEVGGGSGSSVLGTVYQLGRHRVMCGSASDDKDVEILADKSVDMVFTSPPYNISSNMYESYKDSLESKEYIDFNLDTARIAKGILKKRGSLFWNISYNKNSKWEYIDVIYRFMHELGLRLCETIIWDKKGSTPITNEKDLTRAWEYVYHFVNDKLDIVYEKNVYEMYGVMSVGGIETVNKGKNRVKSNLWKIDTAQSQLDNHKACFPVKLPAEAMITFSNPKEIVYDPFLGSGTTLIACEQTDRTCYGMELDEKYLDVIRKRWAKYVYPDRWEKEWEILTPAIEKL